ncbi:uncharacterized protein LOC128176860 [Crassostrea angulata]|uniref:uncharacterized protein LOC128176860 n=1 Tax=Magallana angulata TaxID=2784310 RepID=UPI0022B15971|nr:uncharacterized protein LOC128176860 [Crassostrea angulata]
MTRTPDTPTIPDTIDTTIKEKEKDYPEEDIKKEDEKEKISDTTNVKKTPDTPTIPDTRDTTVMENLETNDDLLVFNSFIFNIGKELIKREKMEHLEYLLNELWFELK